MDGTGYPLRRRKDGHWVQLAPMHCPRGHELKPPNVLVGYGPSPKAVRKTLNWQCQTCGSTIWRDGAVAWDAARRARPGMFAT